MSKAKDAESSLSDDELREAFEVLKEYAPLTPEQARAFFDKLGGLKKVTLDLYERLIQEGQFDLAAEMMADTEARSHNPDPEIAWEYVDILANMKHGTRQWSNCRSRPEGRSSRWGLSYRKLLSFPCFAD